MRLKLGITIVLLFTLWGCTSSPSSQDQLKRLEELQSSPKASVSPSPSPSIVASPSPSITPSPEASPSPEVTPESEPVQSPEPEKPQPQSNKIPLFANCKEAKANGYSDISVADHPEYASKDRDKDGIACES
ncbi:excalibur calcium-binding domain-containing protein [Leptolyngbya sp. AN10]|uniref:excalibur calcium-binding domain-containing protein n=1 Tax=Leptolyngbya sp. AN10 TaxID=3423365 RepID=UPI003D314132